MVTLRFPFRTPEFLAFPPPPSPRLLALDLPCRLAATANALSGVVNSGVLRLHVSSPRVLLLMLRPPHLQIC
jgi:hypothetical protein